MVGYGNSWEDPGSMFQLGTPLVRTNAMTSEATLEFQLKPRELQIVPDEAVSEKLKDNTGLFDRKTDLGLERKLIVEIAMSKSSVSAHLAQGRRF